MTTQGDEHSSHGDFAPKRPCKLLVLDPCPVVREGFHRVIEREENEFTICGELATAIEARDAVQRLEPDILILDLELDHADALELIKTLKALRPSLRILVISFLREEQFAERALRAGADGFLPKSRPGSCIVDALRSIARGGVWFSPTITAQLLRQIPFHQTLAHHCPLSDRELQVYRLIGSGLRTGEIARELALGIKTIETYRGNIKEKLKIPDYIELFHRARRWLESGCSHCACESVSGEGARRCRRDLATEGKTSAPEIES